MAGIGFPADGRAKLTIMKTQDHNEEHEEAKKSLNVLHREPGAPTAGGPDREPAAGEESAEGKLRGVAEPSGGKQRDGGALSGLDEGETWENDSADKKRASKGASPEEQRDQQTR